MSSGESSPIAALDIRVSSPAPEFDDHRPRRGRTPPVVSRSTQHLSPNVSANHSAHVPHVELHEATPPANNTLNPIELLQADDTLRNRVERNLIARDFENAIEDASTHGSDRAQASAIRHGSGVPRRSSILRDIKRSRRFVNPAERSRDDSSSRSTSPANSVEAFAESRRRQRTNTAESYVSLGEFRRQTGMSVDACPSRQPNYSYVSVQPPLTHRTTDCGIDEGILSIDEEPGKTYWIDYEELDEFVALSGGGTSPDQSNISEPSTCVPSDERVCTDLRQAEKEDFNNVALNSETFFETPPRPPTRKNSIATQADFNEKISQPPQVQGPPPDRFTFFSSEIQTPMFGKILGDLVADGNTFRDLFDIGPEGGVWWLDIQNPTKSELEVVAKAFKIHRLTQEDIETQESREKVELFSNYYFVCFRTFNPDVTSEDFLDPVNIYIVVTADGVLSFSYTPNPHAENIRRRIAKLSDFLSLGPDYICYAMIDDIVDSFGPIIHQSEKESENIEDQVFTAREEDHLTVLRQIAECRKRVLNMMRLLGGKADVIKGFAKRCNDCSEPYAMTPRGDIGLYLGDIQDHVVTMMSNLGHVEKMLSRSHSNYLTQVNLDHINKGNSTNKNLAKITVIATIIVPLNLVTGLFGMNVHIPGQDIEDDHYGWFFGIVGLLVLFITTSMLIARKLRYI